jgi:hypothetical protein
MVFWVVTMCEFVIPNIEKDCIISICRVNNSICNPEEKDDLLLYISNHLQDCMVS